MKIRLRVSKEGLARFLSHLDLQRTLERALRRAGLPVAYSQGFHPHPKIAFASALATGHASAGEYVDVELAEPVAPDEFARRLAAQLPQGLRVVAARAVPAGGASLMNQVVAADYLIRVVTPQPVDRAQAEAAVASFLALPAAVITKEGRDGATKQVDVRPLVRRLAVVDEPPGLGGPGPAAFGMAGSAVLAAQVATGPRANLRPEDLVQALAQHAPAFAGAQTALVYRQELYVEGPGGALVPAWEG